MIHNLNWRCFLCYFLWIANYQTVMISFINSNTCRSICCWLCWLLIFVYACSNLGRRIYWPLLWVFWFRHFLIIGGCCFFRVVDVLAIFLGLNVIWADDILRIECRLAVKAETNRAVLIDQELSWNSCGGVVLFLFLLISAIFIVCWWYSFHKILM